MYRRFFKNLSLLFLLNILVKPLWLLGIDLTVQNSVTENAYGIYFSLLNFSLLLQIILDLGISHYNNREIAQSPELLGTAFSKLVSLKLLLAGVYLALALGIALLIGYDSYRIYLLFFLLLNQIMISYIIFFRMNITGLQLYNTDAWLSILDKGMMILIIGFLLWIAIGREYFTISHFILGQTLALVPVTLFTFFIVKNKTTGFQWEWSISDWKKTLKQTLPYAVLILIMTLYFRLDAVMIERLLGSNGPNQTAMYAASFRLLDAVNISGYLLASFLLPLFAKNIKEGKDLKKLSRFCFNAILILAISVCVSFWIHSENIISILYTKGNSQYAEILKILLLTFIPMSSMFVYSTLLTADGKMAEQTKIAVIGLILNVILNLIFILKMNAVGAAIATVLTQSITAILMFRLASKNYNLSWSLNVFAKVIAYVISAVLLALAITRTIEDGIVSILLTFFAVFSLGLLFRFIDRSELKRIIEP